MVRRALGTSAKTRSIVKRASCMAGSTGAHRRRTLCRQIEGARYSRGSNGTSQVDIHNNCASLAQRSPEIAFWRRVDRWPKKCWEGSDCSARNRGMSCSICW